MTQSVLATWDNLVTAQPDANALTESASGRTWTRANLQLEADSWLASINPSVIAQITGSRVTFAITNSAHWFAVFVGLIRAGAVPVPLDPSEPAAMQRQLAAAAEASFALIENQLEPITTTTTLPTRKRSRSAFVLIKLTSGSTGTPRALAFTDAQMIADGRNICATMRIAADDVNFAVIPFGHSYGLGNLVMPLLIQGTAIVCSSVPLPHALAADIARFQPTVFPAVPALLRVLAEADLPANSLQSLRTVISAGTPLSPEIAQSFFAKFNIHPHGFYGSSETGGITYDRTGEATLIARSVGTPLEGVTITPAARGGRVRVNSAAVHGRGSASPADRAAFNEHGELVLKGRSGRLVKIAGRRLDLADLERVLRTLPDIRDAFAATHPQTTEELAAVLATTLDLSAARTLLRRELAPWKVPRRLVVVPDFPLTARGKPDQAALKQLLIR